MKVHVNQCSVSTAFTRNSQPPSNPQTVSEHPKIEKQNVPSVGTSRPSFCDILKIDVLATLKQIKNLIGPEKMFERRSLPFEMVTVKGLSCIFVTFLFQNVPIPKKLRDDMG